MAPWHARLDDPLPRPPRCDSSLPPLPPSDLEDVRTRLSRLPRRKPLPNTTRSNKASNIVASPPNPPDLIPPPFPARNPPEPPSISLSHGRSMSNPFPPLFSARKKPPRKKKPAPDEFDSDSDSDADMSGPGPGSSLRGATQSGDLSTVKPAASRECASGNCMTCGALSRWPKGLKAFKCTLCMTINDLAEFNGAIDMNKSLSGNRTMTSSSEDLVTGSKAPISVEITKRLVKDCLRNYLAAALAVKRGSTDSGETEHAAKFPRPLGGPGTADAEVPPHLQPSSGEPDTPTNKSSDSAITMPEDQHAYMNLSRPGVVSHRSDHTSYPDSRPDIGGNWKRSNELHDPNGQRLFRLLEDYIITCFSPPLKCVNASFTVRNKGRASRPPAQSSRQRPSEVRIKDVMSKDHSIAELDAKLLLLGDFAENGTWWTGRKENLVPDRTPSYRSEETSSVTSRSPNIDWAEVDMWYNTVINAGGFWTGIYEEVARPSSMPEPTDADLTEIEGKVLEAQEHLRKTLLKVTENILKRPGRPINSPEDLRFLLILSSNPLLHASFHGYTGRFSHMPNGPIAGPHAPGSSNAPGPVCGQHSVIIKRIVGLLSNTPAECHNHLISWFSRLPEARFIQLKDLVGGFLTCRLIRQDAKKHQVKVDVTADLIPNMAAGRSPATLHAALGQSRPTRPKKSNKEPAKKVINHEDWQIKAAARVMGLLFSANNSAHYRRHTAGTTPLQEEVSDGVNIRDQVRARGQIVPTSHFYNTLLDDLDLVADFEAWERKKTKFSFCQFPFLLSVGAKIQILEHDARRQMQSKARDAFFDSILSRRNVEQYLTLNVRRDCLVEDSLTGVSEVVGGGGEDIKKGLRIVFQGEEGVDAGGLKKEWFLLLVRDVFNPDHGMFTYDEDSQYCYFNANSFETSDQFFLVGVVIGLAIYNSTILDVALPPFAFRKLLTAAPPPTPGLRTQPRLPMTYSLEDLAEFRPRLARGLRQLLEFSGNVELTFCLDFVVDIDKYGHIERVPLCPGGEHRAVTNANRREFVDLYVKYLLETAVTRQFEPFKRGFFTVCAGNALSLFRPEEIELLVRGSDDPLDIDALCVSAQYENWCEQDSDPAQTESTLVWFWESFKRASPSDQRKLLAFITGSDRIPALGAASLTIRISCLGEDIGRYPTARTCFNSLQLWRFRSRERLEKMLWDAVYQSEGFGLK